MIKIEPSIDKKFIGVPYKLGGNSFEGADCMGLLLLWYKEHGINFEYNENLAITMKNLWGKRPAELLSIISGYGQLVPFQQAQKFDFMLFFIKKREAVFPSYPAVMVDDRHFLSNFDMTESKVMMLDMEWKNLCWGVMRVHKAVELGLR